MEQFFRAKEEAPDALLFFRMGDFYELFYEDAVVAADALDITLTSRGKSRSGENIPMAGVPHHSAAAYLARLLEQGFKVAICEQLADPKTVKGIVPRGIVRTVTPALTLEPDTLDARVDSRLVALRREGDRYGLAALELTRAELLAGEVADEATALAELARLEPRELLLCQVPEGLAKAIARLTPGTPTRQVEPASLDRAWLGDGGRELGPQARAAAAQVLAYAQAAQPSRPLRLERAAPLSTEPTLRLDEGVVRNLELVRTLGGARKGSVLALLDHTKTPMGARALRRRLLAPLLDRAAIAARHDRVEAFCDDGPLRAAVREQLAGIGDVERLATRAELGVAHPRDLGGLRRSLLSAEALRSVLDGARALLPSPLSLEARADEVLGLLETALVEEPPTSRRDGGIFAAGVDAELDELRELSASSKDVLLRMEAREREATGITSLKIKFNKVFGYTIEVTRPNLHLVPEDRYERKQTLANGERYTMPELAELERKILTADERSKAREAALFEDLVTRVAAEARALRALARELADLDVSAALAEVARRFDYARPRLDDSLAIDLADSRHPVVERLAEAGSFVPNDIVLDADGDRRLMLVTGPNMAGKSTAMRQTALAVILAQMGSFVPASEARIGVVDRIFTRIGASDDLGRGQSTFMVEMEETARLLREATVRSLVILDEIGRGTSTYDGLAIAWAVAEHLHDGIGCRGMFATHYHELTALAELKSGVFLVNVAAREYGDEVIFLHRLQPGAANRSYGVAVARLAGVTEVVLARAKAILGDLEEGRALPGGRRASLRSRQQLELFAPAVDAPPEESEVQRTLRELDLDRMTPIDALLALRRLRGMLPPSTG
jgi:DNA mismatch repair protein MutS